MRDYTPGPHFYDGRMGETLAALVHLENGSTLWHLDRTTRTVESAELTGPLEFGRSQTDPSAVQIGAGLALELGDTGYCPNILTYLGDTLFLTEEDAEAAKAALEEDQQEDISME
jgi:hypothetical protein